MITTRAPDGANKEHTGLMTQVCKPALFLKANIAKYCTNTQQYSPSVWVQIFKKYFLI